MIVAALCLGMAACGLKERTATVQPGDGAVATSAVETFVAQLTLSAGQTAVAQLTQLASNTPQVTLISPTTTPLTPTATPQRPTPTPSPTQPPPTPAVCDQAQLIASVSVDDGTVFQAGASFTKTWRLKNTGGCIWTSDYALVYNSGDLLPGAQVVALHGNVNPGQTVDLSVDLTAPDQTGVYSEGWVMRNSSGILFGVGSNGSTPLWVRIQVNEKTQIAYEFISILCAANWVSTDYGTLDCPSSGIDTARGFVTVQPNPILEDGTISDKPAIITFPSQTSNGVISGTYPAFKIKDGDHFITEIGCLYECTTCNVKFYLNYIIDSGSLENLGKWTVTYSRHGRKIDIDLSPLAGESVELILTVTNNGTSGDDWAYWLMPAVYR
jgi:hypothetical protein